MVDATGPLLGLLDGLVLVGHLGLGCSVFRFVGGQLTQPRQAHSVEESRTLSSSVGHSPRRTMKAAGTAAEGHVEGLAAMTAVRS